MRLSQLEQRRIPKMLFSGSHPVWPAIQRPAAATLPYLSWFLDALLVHKHPRSERSPFWGQEPRRIVLQGDWLSSVGTSPGIGACFGWRWRP